MYLLTPHQMIDNDYRLPSYIEPADTPVIPGVDLSTMPEALRALLTKELTVPDMSEEEALNGNGGYPSKLTHGDGGWIETPEATGPPPDGEYRVLSIDCEMVGRHVQTIDLTSRLAADEISRSSRTKDRNWLVYPLSTLRPVPTFSIILCNLPVPSSITAPNGPA